MAFWVGAVQVSKPSPLKGSWAVRGFGPPVVGTATAGVGAGGGATARARASTRRTASGVAP